MSQISAAPLPVIVGFGGFNAAGRSSGHQSYRRMILESLDPQEREDTIIALAVMMKLISVESTHSAPLYFDVEGARMSRADVIARYSAQVLEGTLVRRIEKTFFDVDACYWQKNAELFSEGGTFVFELSRRDLPEPLPEEWHVEALEEGRFRVTSPVPLSVKMASYREMPVKSAGQLPAGFDPAALYNAHFHPRALQLAVIGASDAVRSIGIDWQLISNSVRPDEVAVYASNVMSQMDDNGFGGLLQSRLKGGRVSTKQCPLGLNSMPADFINAYILGSVGHTGAITGACASFLYNLRAAVEDIVAGKCRVAVVGNAEAPILPEIIDGYATMGALASEDKLKKLDDVEVVDCRRSSRPFGENCGFTIAESSQYIVLMDDALAMELGADIHAAVSDVFINADGFKKSISAPGPGNYVTMAKAVAAARAIVGDDAVRNRSFIQAHGSSTPQNRVTESHIFDKVAEVFDIREWPVAAVKAYVGHSLAVASGEQLVASLGVFRYGIVPGIKTIEKVADDVHSDRLQIPLSDLDRRENPLEVAFLNSKGFGGNNATACVLAPVVVEGMLERRYGQEAFAKYVEKREETRRSTNDYLTRADLGQFDTIYQFGEGLIDESAIQINTDELVMPGFARTVNLNFRNRFEDMA